MSVNSLEMFDPLTKLWFLRSLGEPTLVQQKAWPAIASGKHTLVAAPTGTGKTLSAFLVFIDRLKNQARKGELRQELQVIYVSPLKALASDIKENLRRPLQGIAEEECIEFGETANLFDLKIAIRTGDTTSGERRSMIKTPPHILITTPESLYLLLTSKSGQSILCTAHTIIIDELHAMIDSKRGAHLMLSIARLDKLCAKPLQRIGLSATIEPLELAAEYLSPDKVTIVAPKMNKQVKLVITSPLAERRVFGDRKKESIWEELSRMVYEHCKKASSVIAFVEGRRYAEKLAYYINQIGGEGFARTHHGSLSKEQRFEVEQDLREGRLRLLCATSSMELGIDVGEVEEVLQVGCPRSISSTMQRLGRAGHNPGRVSVMHLFPRTASEGLYCGLTAEVARNGGVEYSNPPRMCLDVLAQHLVSMATGEGYYVDEVMEILPRAYPFQELVKSDVIDVLCMLAGDYEHKREIPVRPRILYDRIHERVEGDPYSRMLAISAGGTIPDKGLYTVKSEQGVKLGELDEEFVFESRVGDRFLLGTFAWKITDIKKDTVTVTQANTSSARLPFWKGEIKGRRIKTGLAFGEIFRRLGKAYGLGTLSQELSGLGLDNTAVISAKEFLERQIKVTNGLPDDRTIIIEHFKDETGNRQIMVHSVFGRQVNAPLAILASEEAKRITNVTINYVDDDDGFLLFPYSNCYLPEGLLQQISPKTARGILEAILPATPVFNMTFRYNAARAMMMGVRKSGRVPLWVQRMRSAEMLNSLVEYNKHPLIRETRRECLEDLWDLSGVQYVLNGIQSGLIQVRELHLEIPSPMSFLLRQETEASMMYSYAPTPIGIHFAAEEALKENQGIAPAEEELLQVTKRSRLPEDEKQLHSLMMIEGDFVAGELKVPIEWLETLIQRGQVAYIDPGLWIAAEYEETYKNALYNKNIEAKHLIVSRLLRYHGAWSLEQISERYLWSEEITKEILNNLCSQGSIVEFNGLYYHEKLYHLAQKETIKNLRRQITTLPSERYAALLTERIQNSAPPEEQLEIAMKDLCGLSFSPEVWESILLPGRVTNYRPELLDILLSKGNICWQLSKKSGLVFHEYEDMDWDIEDIKETKDIKDTNYIKETKDIKETNYTKDKDNFEDKDNAKNIDNTKNTLGNEDADLASIIEGLLESERIIYYALLKRGASFMQRLNSLLGGESSYDTLLNLAEKGLVCADTYIPIRQWLIRSKLEKASPRQRVNARMAMSSGRFELTRPQKELTIEQKLERSFERTLILCRETIQDISWGKALELLRIWEYTGRVRRGYFIEGMSGIQFIREKDFAGAMFVMEHPKNHIFWISAIDPAQPWGKSLPHQKERSFLNVAGTVVALKAGLPIAVFERQGKVLRIFDETSLSEAISEFVQSFISRRIYSNLSRITVKNYPGMAADELLKNGFMCEIKDYVLYRK